MKDIDSVLTVVVLIVGMLIGYNHYTNAKNIEQKMLDREAYMECLRITEKLLKEKPDRVSTPYCRL